MKQLNLLLLMAIMPLVSIASQPDSILLELKTLLYDNNYLHQLSRQSQTSNIEYNNIINSKVAKTRKTLNWFGDAWDAFTSLFQPVWGTYTEGGSTNNTLPLTTFERIPDITVFKTDIIKYIANKDNGYYEIYLKIYNNAKGATTASCGDAGVCELAARAKDAAFVYLIGVDENGDTLTESTTPKRSFFKDQFSYIITGWYLNAGSYGGKSNQTWRAKENIMLMQAYDYMQLSNFTGGSFPETMRDNCREEIFTFTYELYSRSNNYFQVVLKVEL